MPELCTKKDCYSYGRYCRITWHMGAAKKNDEEEKKETEKKKQTTKKIAPLSKKRQKLQRVYRKQVAEALKKDNRCKVKSPVCIGVANGFQHIEKRSAKNLTDKKNQIPCCAACQTWIEENPKKAIEMGVSKSKFLSASVEG